MGVPSAVAWRGAAGLAPITAQGMEARDDHARQRWGQAKGGADGKANLHVPEAGDRQRVRERSRATHVSLTIVNKRDSGERAKTSPFRQSN